MGGTVNSNANVDFDSILKKIGQCGKWQWLNFFILWLTSAAGGLAVVVYSFTANRPAYRCAIPYCNDESFDFSLTGGIGMNSSLVIPLDSLETNSKCQYYYPEGLFPPETPSESTCTNYLNELKRDGVNLQMGNCEPYDVLFDRSIIRNSLAMDYGFTCDNSYQHQIVGAIYMVGMLVGSFVLGFISDHFGRMKALMISVILVSVSGFLGAFMPEPIGFAVMRLLTGMGGIGCFMVTFVLAVEYVGFKYTMLIGIAIEIPFALGEMVLGLEAYYIRDWKSLQLVAYTPLILLLLLWFIVPESPRWLIAKGRLSEARDIIAKAAKINGKTKLDIDNLFKSPTNNVAAEIPQKSEANFFSLFTPKIIMFRSLNMFYQWLSVTMCYYGLTFASASFSDDIYRDYTLSVFMEIPAYIFCIIVMDAWGRRPILSFCQLVSGISCVLAGLFGGNEDLDGVVLFLALLGKFGASACFAIVYVYTAELFPTIIRNTAIGSSSTIARVGGILAILVGLIADYWKAGPMIIMGIVAIVAGVLAFFLPETVGNPLPESMDDAINIGKNSKRGFCYCKCPDLRNHFKDDDESDSERI